jgi:TonB family protein
MPISTRAALTSRQKSVLSLAAAILLCSASAFAEAPPCKSKGGEVKVAYPDLARRMKITGVVRLELQLTASGSVRETKILGGNPVLVSAAQQAVKQTKFEGSETCIAVFEFRD